MADNSLDALDTLVARHRRGESTAFADLVAATNRRVRSCIAARIWILDAVEEVVQDTYVEAFEHLERYEGGGRFQAWLLGIARNRCRSWLEQRQRESSRRDPIADLAASLPEEEDEEAPDHTEELARLHGCIEGLQDRAKTLVERHYQDGWSLERLARQNRVTAGSLAVALFRIRRSLRTCLERQS
jgi:RNA polymerase sigma-70 factor (ECF subfamily)